MQCKKISKIVREVKSHHTKFDVKCNSMPVKVIYGEWYENLTLETPQDITSGSGKKVWWLCKCGKRTLAAPNTIIRGGVKSCGRCNLIPAEKIKNKPYGDLVIETPQDVMPGSHEKIWWLCKCGKRTLAVIYSVICGDTKSCGECNLVTAEELSKRKFGKLRVKNLRDVHPYSIKKIECICDCGNEPLVKIRNLFCDDTKSCGKCFERVRNWYTENKDKLKSLVFPIKPEDFISGGVIPLETIKSTGIPFKAVCCACRSIYYPRFGDVKLGISLTCGCSYNKISLDNIEIQKFIQSLGVETELEFKINSFSYDVFVPKFNVLIELNGLKWHSTPTSKKRDIEKYKLAVDNEYDYLMIFEDELARNRPKVESLLKNKFSVIDLISVRPSQCEIKTIFPKEADLFYDRFHYIGKCHPQLTYGVFYDSKLIAAISFSHPTRQSKHQWELVRMASDPTYKVHGIWGKLLEKFVKEQSPISIVSFSDNRLFSGKVYEKIGFKFDGNVTPDYYWVKNQKRFHKSALRKKGEEKISGLTKTQLREAQGYKKIWDLGKKRWVYNSVTV
jgi:hypothetical protein